jgi:predicted alpha/beta hydrolase family esterase
VIAWQSQSIRGEVARVNEQLWAKAAELKKWIEMLEQENRQLSEVNQLVKRDIGEALNAAGT